MQPELLTFQGYAKDEKAGEGGREDGGVWEVTRPVLGGVEPGGRMGHSCSYLPSLRCLVVVGGSDGSDLLRNGRELLQQVYFISLEEVEEGGDEEEEEEGGGGPRGGWIRVAERDGGTFGWPGGQVVEWSLGGKGGKKKKKGEGQGGQPLLWPRMWNVPQDRNAMGAAPTQRHETFTGRTHTAHVLMEQGKPGEADTLKEEMQMAAREKRKAKLLLFGGDSRLSDAVGVMEVQEVVEEMPGGEWSTGKRVQFHPLQRLTERRPGPRLSHASVLAGERLLVHGGWCEYEKGDMHSLCLTPSYSSLASFSSGGVSSSPPGLGGLDLNGHVEEMSGEEEEEEEDSDYVGSSGGGSESESEGEGGEEEEEEEEEGEEEEGN